MEEERLTLKREKEPIQYLDSMKTGSLFTAVNIPPLPPQITICNRNNSPLSSSPSSGGRQAASLSNSFKSMDVVCSSDKISSPGLTSTELEEKKFTEMDSMGSHALHSGFHSDSSFFLLCKHIKKGNESEGSTRVLHRVLAKTGHSQSLPLPGDDSKAHLSWLFFFVFILSW